MFDTIKILDSFGENYRLNYNNDKKRNKDMNYDIAILGYTKAKKMDFMLLVKFIFQEKHLQNIM